MQTPTVQLANSVFKQNVRYFWPLHQTRPPLHSNSTWPNLHFIVKALAGRCFELLRIYTRHEWQVVNFTLCKNSKFCYLSGDTYSLLHTICYVTFTFTRTLGFRVQPCIKINRGVTSIFQKFRDTDLHPKNCGSNFFIFNSTNECT